MGAILILAAFVCFILRAFGVGAGTPDLGWLGLALYAAAALVGYLPASFGARRAP